MAYFSQLKDAIRFPPRAILQKLFCLVAVIFAPFILPAAPDATQKPLLFLGDKDYPPVAYLENGVAKGMDVDLAKALAAPLHREVRVELMDWNLAQEKVLDGEADGLVGLSISPEREKLFNFAAPTFSREFGLLVRSDEMTIHSTADLDGKRVGVTAGGFPRKFFETQSNFTVVLVDNYEDGLDQLTNRTIDAVAADLWVAAYVIEKNGIRGVTIAGKPFATAQEAVAVRKGNTALLNEITRATLVLRSDGTISQIEDNWRPQQIVFASRRQIRDLIFLVSGIFLAVVLGAMTLWIFTLKRQIRIRKKVELALMESESHYRNLTEAAFEGVCISENGKILDVNNQFLTMFGYQKRDEVIGLQIIEFVTPECRASVAERIRTEQETIYGHELLRKDGSSFFAEAQARIVRVGDRTLRMTALRDITGLKKAEEALRESEEKFSKAFRTSPDVMSITDFKNGIYLEVNDAHEKTFGFKREEVIGHSPTELGIYENTKLREEMLELLKEKGRFSDVEIEAQTRDGKELTLLHSAELIELGGRSCVLRVSHDITERKQAEAEREAAVAREQQARLDYTLQLIASQEAERARIAGELHDSLGQNLLLIKNYAQAALTNKKISDEAYQQIEAISGLATQSIAEARSISHDLHPYQINHLGLTRALEAMIDMASQSSSIIFQRKLDNVDDIFSKDAATNLYRIVQESLNNILKHSRAENAHIRLERDVHEVQLAISDDGRGFSVEKNGKGMGLKNIAARARILGGKLKVDSASGKGTNIEIKIPIAAEAE